MSAARLVLFEHERLSLERARGGLRVPRGRGEGVLTEAMLDALDRDSPLQVRRGGVIHAPGLVGILSHAGATVELLPKVDKARPPEDARRNLLEMLLVSGALPGPRDEGAAQKMSRLPLLEALLSLYARALEAALLAGPHASYEAVEENLTRIKGRLHFPEQLRRNLTAPHRAVCRYRRFTTDNRLNQVFRYVTWQSRRVARAPETRRRLDALNAHLGDVSLRVQGPQDCDRIQLDRLTERFEPPLRWARILLSSLRPDLRAGRTPAFDLVFDMARVFEDWVAVICRRHLRGRVRRIRPQARIGHLLHTDDGRDLVAQIPDLLFEPFEGPPVVLDTKYKRFPGLAEADIGDLRQVYLYQALLRPHHPASAPRLSVLLYPADSGSPPCTEEAWLFDRDERPDRVRVRLATVGIEGVGAAARAAVAERVAGVCGLDDAVVPSAVTA